MTDLLFSKRSAALFVPVSSKTSAGKNNCQIFRGCRYLLAAFGFYGIDMVSITTKGIFRFLKLFQYVIFHLIYVDYIVMIFLYGEHNHGVLKALCAYGLHATSVLLLWHIMRRDRKQILGVLKDLFVSTPHVKFKWQGISVVNGLALLVLSFPLLSSLVMVFLMTRKYDRYHTFYFYSEKVEHFSFGELAYLFFKHLAQCILLQVYTGLATLLYCSVCFRLNRRLWRYHEMFAKLKDETKLEIYCPMMRRYIKFLDTVNEVEAVFSKVAFFLVVANFMSIFTILATTFYYSKKHVTTTTRTESFFTFINAGFCLIFSTCFAAQVSLEISRISNLFHRLLENWKCNGRVIHGDFQILAEAVRSRPTVQLSGCEVFYFKRNGILAMFGTLLTYGLLILQLRS